MTKSTYPEGPPTWSAGPAHLRGGAVVEVGAAVPVGPVVLGVVARRAVRGEFVADGAVGVSVDVPLR